MDKLITTYAKFLVRIHGIYEWGQCFLHEKYPELWAKACQAVKNSDIDFFSVSNLIPASRGGFAAVSERFVGERFYAYMNPMAVEGMAVSCPNCTTENEGENFGNKVKDALVQMVEVIKSNIPPHIPGVEIKAEIVVKCVKFDIDNPDYIVKA